MTSWVNYKYDDDDWSSERALPTKEDIEYRRWVDLTIKCEKTIKEREQKWLELGLNKLKKEQS